MPDDLGGFLEEFEESLGWCRRCQRVHTEEENAVGGCPLRDLEDPPRKYRRTLRCVLRGCKPTPGCLEGGRICDLCDCTAGVCERCSNVVPPQLPTARIAR